MKKIIYLSLIVFAFAACKKDQQSPSKTIVGNWQIRSATISFYLKGKQVGGQNTDTDNQSKDAWQFDGNGNLKLAPFKDGAIDHTSEQSLTYQVKEDSLIVSTGTGDPIKLGLAIIDKNTMILTQTVDYGTPQSIDGPPAFTADMSKTKITYKRL